jgi:hypothetical protein
MSQNGTNDGPIEMESISTTQIRWKKRLGYKYKEEAKASEAEALQTSKGMH